VMFTLAPATRWGYFVYPLALVGWMVLTQPPAVDSQDPAQPTTVPARAGVRA